MEQNTAETQREETPFGYDLPNRKLVMFNNEHALNEVYALGPDDEGGAPSMYSIWRGDHSVSGIDFQRGPRNDPNSTEGAADEDLLKIVFDRLQSFQRGPYECEENGEAGEYIRKALIALKRRQDKRAARGVLGTSEV